MSDIQPGDVIPMKNFTASYDGCELKFGKLTKNRKYAFLLLGAGSPESPLDVNQCLNALGWVFAPEKASKQLEERKSTKTTGAA